MLQVRNTSIPSCTFCRWIKKKKDRKPGALHIYYGTTMVECVCMLCDAPVRFQGKKKMEGREASRTLPTISWRMYVHACCIPCSVLKENCFCKEERRLAHFLRYLEGCMYMPVAYHAPFSRRIVFARKRGALHTCYDTSMNIHIYDATQLAWSSISFRVLSYS